MTNTPSTEQAVIIQFDYGNSDWSPFFAFDERLEDAVAESGLGDYDGNELAADGSDGQLYFYGPDADKLFALVKAIIAAEPLLKNVRATLRYGAVDDPNAREMHIQIAS
jgi:hypothetical protein